MNWTDEQILDAEKSVLTKEKFEDLTELEIEVLRCDMSRNAGINPDMVNKLDRLRLIRCILILAENRDYWASEARKQK